MLRRFFRDAFFTGVVNLALLLKSFVLVPLLSKKFGAVGYGSWAQVVVLVGLLSPLLGLGIEYGYSRYMPQRPIEEHARKLWSMVWFKTVTAIGCFLVLWAASGPIAEFLLGTPKEYLLVVVCGLVIYANVLLNDLKRFFKVGRVVALYNGLLLVQGFGGVAVIFGAYLLGGGVLEIVAASAAFDLLLALGCLSGVAARFGIGPPNIETARKFIAFGWVLLPAGYATWTLNLSDRMFLAHYRTLSDVGVYAVAYALGYLPIQVIFNPIWTFYYPTATVLWERGERSEIQRLFRSSLKLAGSLVILAMGLMVAFYGPIIRLVATDQFLAGPWLAPLVCTGYLFLMVGAYGSVVLNLAKFQRFSTYAHISAAVSNLLLNWLLIPRLGIHGAAMATCLSFGLQCVMEFYFSARHLLLRPPLLYLIKSIAASGLLVLVARLLDLGSGSLLGFLGYCTVFSLLYVLIMFFMRAFTVTDIRHALGRLRVLQEPGENGSPVG